MVGRWKGWLPVESFGPRLCAPPCNTLARARSLPLFSGEEDGGVMFPLYLPCLSG